MKNANFLLNNLTYFLDSVISKGVEEMTLKSRIKIRNFVIKAIFDVCTSTVFDQQSKVAFTLTSYILTKY